MGKSITIQTEYGDAEIWVMECPQCGKRASKETRGWITCARDQWHWVRDEISDEEHAMFDFDFCSERCIGMYFTGRTAE